MQKIGKHITMKNIFTRYPFFLMLLPAFVVIHFEKEFHLFIKYEFIYDRIIILFSVPILSFLFFFFFFRSARKSSLMTFGFLLFFYYTGDLKNWLSAKLPDSVWQKYTFLMSVSLLILLILFFALKKNKSVLRKPYFFINLALVLFIAADIAGIILTGNNGKYKIVSETEINNTACDTCLMPDIYYIIFDAYASSQQLQKEFSYSNTQIEDELKHKGFLIIPNSKSNYSYTDFSVGSTLNMNYINNVDTVNITTDRMYMQALRLVYKNRFIPFLQKENYSIFNHSPFDIEYFSTSIKGFDFWNIQKLFDQYNLAFKLIRDIGYHFFNPVKNFIHKDDFYINSPENKVRFDSTVYQHLLQSIKFKSIQPKFVYAHFLKTHPPYFFDSLGQEFTNHNMTYHERYVHQISYANNLIKKITDSILVHTQRPSIIIIQGDHGICFDGPVNPQHVFPNFSAIYFSNKDYRLISDSTSNVNTFRIVLNTFFKKDLKLLPYQSYFFLN